MRFPKVFQELNFLSLCLLICGLLGLSSTAKGNISTNRTVLLNNTQQLIPLKNLDQKKIIAISFDEYFQEFNYALNKYTNVDSYVFSGEKGKLESWNQLDEEIKLYNTLIFTLKSQDLSYSLLLKFIQSQAIGKDVIIAFEGKGTDLSFFDFAHFPILWIPESGDFNHKNAAMTIFGGVSATQTLDQNYSLKYVKNAGFLTHANRINYFPTLDPEVSYPLLRDSVDAIMEHGMREKAFPGGVVMILKEGKVIFEKAYGYHTYEKQTPTTLENIFDLASISKIAATTPVAMKLTETGLMDLDKTMGHYLWQAENSNKKDITLREVMLHEAGFIPYIPFYRDLSKHAMSSDSSAEYSVKVADGAYIKTGYYENVMWPIMMASDLNERGKYVYSDISMYVIKEVAEHITGVPIEQYIQDQFYKKLGMKTAGFNPRERFEKNRIIPTEDDQVFRKTLLQGYVHDQGAAMAGGIAGHAGLFSTANDLAIYGQLLLNRGSYGDEIYFKPETVDKFTSGQSKTSRRGLGFDRKDPDPTQKYPSFYTSEFTYGHTGYTGTSMWVDPESKLIYIFLSNRVHPEVSGKLSTLAIRMRIFDAIYQSLGKK